MDPQPLPCWWILDRTKVFNTRQVQPPRPPTLTLFVQFHGAVGREQAKKSVWMPKKKHTPKQVLLDDVGGDIMSKIPTSPSFLILFEHIKYDWNNTARLHPFKKTTWDNYSLIIIQLFHEVLVFCFGTTRFPREKRHTVDNPELAIKKLCQAPSCATHGGESYIGGKKWEDPCVDEPPFQELWDASFVMQSSQPGLFRIIPMNLFLALASWEGELPEQYESDWFKK